MTSLAGVPNRQSSIYHSPIVGAEGIEDGSVAIWEVETGRRLHRMDTDGAVTSLAFSADGARLAAATEGGTLWLWEGDCTLASVRLPSAARSVEFSSDGTTLLSAGDGGAIRLSSVESGERLRAWTVDAGAARARFLPGEEAILWAGAAGACHELDLDTGVSRLLFEGDGGPAFALGPEARCVLSGARLLERESGGLVAELAPGALDVALSPDGRLAVSADGSRTLRVRDIHTGREVRTYAWHGAGALTAAFSRDSASLVSGGRDGSLHLWSPGSDADLNPGSPATPAESRPGAAGPPEGKGRPEGSILGRER